MQDSRDFVTALARGLSVIRAFDRDHPQLTLSQVAARAGLSPATARRCLFTLEQLGYVGSSGRLFMLRPKVVELGSGFLASVRIEEVIQPILRDVVAEVGDSASLGVLEGDDVLYVANFSAKRFVQLTAGVGTRFPAYAVSMGRVLLAALPDHELEDYLARIRPAAFTPSTVIDPAVLRERIEDVRHDGHVVVAGELEEGLEAAAVPVRLKSGRVIAALNASRFARASSTEGLRRSIAVLESAAGRLAEAAELVPTLAAALQSPRGREEGR
ncbi:IclR family transcriptional regulator domain-containing protein [Faunimonas sp. B44]|uniref:IclR family transcriptional regulator domain-containing protein n=1 Tax=Faunimonas sp. B44 TaxID=3461493 RepID=UPI004044D3B3